MTKILTADAALYANRHLVVTWKVGSKVHSAIFVKILQQRFKKAENIWPFFNQTNLDVGNSIHS